MFFNLLSISQLIQILRIGPLISYLLPFIYVLCTTIIKEAYEDFQRGQRDKEVNEKIYKKLNIFTGQTNDVQAQEINTGDIIQVNSNERIPADMVCLFTADKSGIAFIRTDQIDGETDWKVRQPVLSI